MINSGFQRIDKMRDLVAERRDDGEQDNGEQRNEEYVGEYQRKHFAQARRFFEDQREQPSEQQKEGEERAGDEHPVKNDRKGGDQRVKKGRDTFEIEEEQSEKRDGNQHGERIERNGAVAFMQFTRFGIVILMKTHAITPFLFLLRVRRGRGRLRAHRQRFQAAVAFS